MPSKKSRVIKMDNAANKQLVVKSNYLIEASYRLTTQEQRIILLLASMIHPDDKDFQAYRIEIKDFMNLIKVTGHSKYEETKQIAKKLRERTLVIKKPNSELHVGWLSSIEYFKGEGFVELCFDPKLKPYLLNLKECFTKYQLKNVIQLKSAYSIRLYELLKQYEKVGERQFDLIELKNILGIKPAEYKQYGHFKNKILNRAKNELPKQTDLKFTFSEKKKARKVVGIHFFIKSKRDAKPVQEITNLELYERLQQYFCLSPTQARGVLKQYDQDPARVKENLNHVERRYTKGEIENIGAYTLKAIENDIRDQLSLFDVEKKQECERRKQAEAEKQRQERLESDYKTFRYNEIEKYKKTFSEAKLGQIEAAVSEEVKNKSKSDIGFKTFVRLELEKQLAALAGIPSFENWAQQQN